jgi:hypothetical protein
MSWAMLPGIGGRIRTAAAAGGLIAIFALSVPAPAFAMPAPPADPDCMADSSNPACQSNEPPTSSDDSRCVDFPTSGACLYSPYTSDDDD